MKSELKKDFDLINNSSMSGQKLLEYKAARVGIDVYRVTVEGTRPTRDRCGLVITVD